MKISRFNLITSNRLEYLISVLSDVIKQPLQSPFTQELIIIQNRGMERFLSLKLSEHLGIWANCNYPFPSAYIQKLFQLVLPELPLKLQFDPEYLPWKIMTLLPELLHLEAYQSLRSYLQNGNNVTLFQLSTQIADLFDRYTVYRSAMVDRWKKGEENHWQADLWRRLNCGECDHRVQIGEIITQKVQNNSLPEQFLPERLSIFGVSTLPPFHLNMLYTLSQKVDIYFYLLNPCAEYWDDICSEKDIAKKLRKRQKRQKKSTAELLHLEQGNPLLASMGMYGQEIIKKLHSLDIEEFTFQVNPGESKILHAIQSDILYLRTRGDDTTPKIPISSEDRSLQIHSCHSVMREVEVLFDQLLDLFANIPDLKPSDIVVMTPDINVYASAVEAVFGNVENQNLKLLYSLSDKCGDGSNRIHTLFLMLLAIPNSRFSVTKILELLDFKEVQNAFSLTERDCELVTRWIQDTAIRWSIDGISKQQFDCPTYDENTWKHGLEQLLLGYALPTEPDRSFMNLFGYNHIEGTMAETLGNFVTFFKMLVEFNTLCTKSHSLSGWSDILLSFVDKLFSPDDLQEKDLVSLRKTVSLLIEIETNAGFKNDVSFELIKYKLTNDLNNQMLDQGFFNGGITFCSMLPMRSIPFRVVCCIGMGDNAFPRKSSFSSWDLIATNPQPGDRSLEHEDRYLFLEALCSARDIFYVSFIKDPRGKSSGERQSVVVDELLDYCEHAFYVPENSSVSSDESTPSQKNSLSFLKVNPYLTPAERLVTRHRLQAFHPLNFTDTSPLFSYSKVNLDAAKSLISNKMAIPPILENPLDEPDAEFRNITIDDLINFFCGPADFFLSRRLGVTIKNRYDNITDEEPFDIQGIDKYLFTDKFIDSSLKGTDTQYFFNKETASGTLPHGNAGKIHYAKLSSEVLSFVDDVKEVFPRCINNNDSVIINLDNYCITGSLTRCCDTGALYFRYADVKAVDRLKLWFTHLIVQIHTGSNAIESTLFCKNGKWRYISVSDPLTILKNMCDLYWTGLSKPIHFFPETSWAYASEIIEKNGDNDRALKAASKIWYGNDYSKITPECEKIGNRLFLNSINPLDDKFADIAVGVFGDLIRSCVRI